ncbi:nuclear transport factor 2 family protein [Gymnodinialimonas ceratoperidinii]|uniref:Nuclear transport factor 2 family protein n=1 Tax=Gymnodinialimonas ceratoperidinii TaxID=2856823 RepID=A0A8F6Y9P4_9RHOB|nr:nuclear transport factor 2 family protein [Gymnodinialimonas ceratoperidinii]QXT39159.1 nuclear transport factor 2 family protein [Gymnodinialimonas ceratoperidinii]
MDMKDIARALAEGCRAGGAKVRENLDALYADDAVSVEAADMGGQGRETRGKAAIHGKHDWWDSAMEEYGSSVTGPFYHGDDQFSLYFEVDATDKESGRRMQMKEIGVYHVAEGKIVREEFHYLMDDA